MIHRLTLAWVLLFALAACAPTPTPIPSPSPAPTATASPSPNATIDLVCPPVPLNGLTPGPGSTAWCAPEEVAVETAVAALGYPVQRITIRSYGFTCGQPFPAPGSVTCLSITAEPSAYVTFRGTDNVAALTLTTTVDGPIVAKLVAFQVPPPDWSST